MEKQGKTAKLMVKNTNYFQRIVCFLRVKEQIMSESLMLLFLKEQQERFAHSRSVVGEIVSERVKRK